jgi:prepilin-type N-terminal cleavage/methylation domain-containing protein
MTRPSHFSPLAWILTPGRREGRRLSPPAPVSGTAALPSRRRCRRDESGLNLIEIIITIAILGIAIVALVTGLLDAVGTSTIRQQDATVDTQLRDYAEAVKSAVQSSCTATPPNGTYSPSFSFLKDAGGNPYRATVISSPYAFGTCPPATAVAQLTITMSTPVDQTNQASSSLVIDVIDP